MKKIFAFALISASLLLYAGGGKEKKRLLLENAPKKEIKLLKEDAKRPNLLEINASPVLDSGKIASIQKDFKNLSLCGERIPLENPEVFARFMQQYTFYSNSRGIISYYQKMSSRYRRDITQVLQRHGLHPDLFYVAVAESGLSNLTSSQGARGFWQFMQETAGTYNLEVSHTVDERLHPQKASEAAARYLKNLYRRYGRWALAAAAYNMGEGALDANIASQGKRDYYHLSLNPETGAYVYRIAAVKAVMEKQGNPFRYSAPRFTTYKIEESIADLRAFAEQECGVEYEDFKLLNPWLINHHLDVKGNKTYEVRIPLSRSTEAKELIPLPFAPDEDYSFLRDSIIHAWRNS